MDTVRTAFIPPAPVPRTGPVGTIELIQVLSEKLSLTGSFFDWVNNLDFNLIGYLIVAMFVVINFVVDVIYTLLDPRVRLSGKEA